MNGYESNTVTLSTLGDAPRGIPTTELGMMARFTVRQWARFQRSPLLVGLVKSGMTRRLIKAGVQPGTIRFYSQSFPHRRTHEFYATGTALGIVSAA